MLFKFDYWNNIWRGVKCFGLVFASSHLRVMLWFKKWNTKYINDGYDNGLFHEHESSRENSQVNKIKSG